MDFRFIVLCFSLWLAPVWADTMTELDDLAATVYQYPNDALSKITVLENNNVSVSWTEKQQLKFALIQCETYVQLGENEAAINLARLNDAKAKTLNIPQARPYFLNCMAEAYIKYGDIRHALSLLDSAIFQARELQQAQSLVQGLLLRGKINTDTDNDNSAFEDLRLARDVYPDIQQQTENWITSPEAYIYLALAELMHKKGQLNQAFTTAKLALDLGQTQGKVRLNTLLVIAKIAHFNQEFSFRDQALSQAQTLIPQIASAAELAESYTQLAEVEFLRDNPKSAIQLLTIALNTFDKQKKINDSLNASRLLAQVLLADGETAQGLNLMQQAVEIAQRTNQHDELEHCYHILSEHFAKANDFQQAYRYQLKRYQSTQSKNEYLKETRLSQIKAQLGQYQQLAQQQQPKTAQLKQQLRDNYALIGIFLLLFILSLFTLLSRFRQKNTQAPQPQGDAPLTAKEKMDVLLSTAKQLNYPINLLLLNTQHIPIIELDKLITQVEKQLRQQDILLNNRGEKLMIMLPFSSENEVKALVQALKTALKPWQNGNKVAIGIASMQHHDTLASMIKRANVDQLSRYNDI
ncbi:histidine kinase [Shewanella sp. Isolate11]|uniref:tetratricopeptide repeat protein n=1 Tax=Shewanella sp. Isolate11 TaxID=2908530 RepID=UPI001EFE3503|nr:histidine kinase [Shewanella sp. Isolate11]MCG9697787.1 histidine kinase [Shewanella sp. Isolate11]